MALENGAMPIEQLQAALACLDLELDSELALYRRQRLPTESEVAKLPETLRRAESGSAEGFAVNAEPDFNSWSELGQGDALRLTDVPTEDVQDVDGEISSALSTDLVPCSEPSEEFETLPEPYSTAVVSPPEILERFLDPSIEDYLESSEALLKHLDDSEEVAIKPAPVSPKSVKWLLPVLGGIGAVAVLAWILTSVLTHQFAPTPSKPKPTSSVLPQTSQTPQAQTSPVPRPAGTETAKPLSNVGTGALLPEPSPSSSPSAYYVVVAPYRGDASLQQARQLVPDAFIENVQGQRQIQLAFLDDPQRAQRLVNDLKTQGFLASIVGQN